MNIGPAAWLVAGISAALPAAAAEETYVIDPVHSQPQWQARHIGFSNQHGNFGKLLQCAQHVAGVPADTIARLLPHEEEDQGERHCRADRKRQAKQQQRRAPKDKRGQRGVARHLADGGREAFGLRRLHGVHHRGKQGARGHVGRDERTCRLEGRADGG